MNAKKLLIIFCLGILFSIARPNHTLAFDFNFFDLLATIANSSGYNCDAKYSYCRYTYINAQYKIVDYNNNQSATYNACRKECDTSGYSYINNLCRATSKDAQYKIVDYNFSSVKAYNDCRTKNDTSGYKCITKRCSLVNVGADYKLSDYQFNHGLTYNACFQNCSKTQPTNTTTTPTTSTPINPTSQKVLSNSVADYILKIQQTDGAIPDAFDNPYYNQDNDTGYALSGLFYAYLDTKNTKYLEAIKSNLIWMSKLQDQNGCWNWAYKKSGSTYYPVVNDYYQNNGISAIKSVDAIQSYFARNLWLLATTKYDDQTVKNLTPIAIKGIQCLIQNNMASDGFFFSSLQYKQGSWQKFGMKYSAGQADVYLGLMSAYKLSGDKEYYNFAQKIKNNFDQAFFDQGNQRYYVGISDTAVPATGFYPMSQGYNAWVFKSNSEFAKKSLQYLINNQQTNGAIYNSERAEKEAIFSAFLSLGESQLNINSSAKIKANTYIKSLQTISNSISNGGIKMSPQFPYLYTNISGFAIMALSPNINFDPFE